MRSFGPVFFLALAFPLGAMGNKEEAFILHYSSPQDKIVINGLSVLWESSEFSFDNPVSSVPSSSRTVSHELSLTSRQLEALENLILQVDFFHLKDVYGAPDRERFYPYSLSVTYGDRKKTVSFHSHPQFESAPRGFAKIERFLMKLRPSS